MSTTKPMSSPYMTPVPVVTGLAFIILAVTVGGLVESRAFVPAGFVGVAFLGMVLRELRR